jgi:iron(III) transport system ATP-binding protein
MNRSPILNLDCVSKKFSSKSIPVITEVSFKLEEGEILGLLGPSGCGKTTLLRIIAGFTQPSSGRVELAGNVVNCPGCWIPPEKRNTGMVFQDYALFPHLTIADNIAFGLKKNFKKDLIKKKVAEVLELVGLTGLEKRYPHELSGGQQQRIALARAIAPQPALILLDEPLSNLDVQVRQRLRSEIRSILKAAGTSAIFVTHDREEALAICDRIGVMYLGKLEQIGTPEEIYLQPQSRFVAEFVSQANFLPAQRKGDFWKTEISEIEISTAMISEYGDRGDLMLRQEEIILKPDDKATTIVRDRQFLGREYRYCLETASGKELHARTTTTIPVAVGEKVRLLVTSPSPKIFLVN